jgi:prevent-host-death family protein
MFVNVHEAKSQLSALIAKAEAGEEVVIARANRPVVRLVPMEPALARRRLGEAKGLVTIPPDFEDLPEDYMEHFK